MKHISEIFPGITLPAIPPEREEENRAAQEAAEQKQWAEEIKKIRHRMISMGLPLKDVDMLTGASGRFLRTQAIQAVEQDEQRGQRMLVLSGDKGCGKTTAAAWWLNLPGPSFEWDDPFGQRVRGARFISLHRFERMSRYDQQALSEIEFARRLVLDDLGSGEYVDQKGHLISLVDGLIDWRYANKLPTLFTTNLDAGEFKARYGERIADRIRECGRFVSLNEKSLRGRVVSDSEMEEAELPWMTIESQSRAGERASRGSGE